MTCPDARAQLSALVDDALAPPARRALEAHLAACPECQRELDRLFATVSALGRLARVRAPAGFADRVIRAAFPRPWYRRLGDLLFVPWRLKLPLEAAAVALLVVAAVYLPRRVPEVVQLAREATEPSAARDVAPAPARPSLPLAARGDPGAGGEAGSGPARPGRKRVEAWRPPAAAPAPPPSTAAPAPPAVASPPVADAAKEAAARPPEEARAGAPGGDPAERQTRAGGPGPGAIDDEARTAEAPGSSSAGPARGAELAARAPAEPGPGASRGAAPPPASPGPPAGPASRPSVMAKTAPPAGGGAGAPAGGAAAGSAAGRAATGPSLTPRAAAPAPGTRAELAARPLAALARASDASGRLLVPARAPAEAAVDDLLPRIGATRVGRRVGDAAAPVVVELLVPAARYGELTTGLRRIGHWEPTHEPTVWPDAVRVEVAITDQP
jgi:hypothetical protein